MDEVRARTRDGAPDGTVVVASRQTQGRGRHGRDWISPEGNLYTSVLLRPELPQVRLTELGFVAALAVADAVDAALPGGRARLKWPNDVLINGAKVAGILVEIVEGNAAVIGVGINIAQAPEAISYPTPQAMPYPITCLHHAGATTASSATVLTQLLAALERQLSDWIEHGFAWSRAAWLARGPAVGEMVRVRIGGRIETGRFAGLDIDGALLLHAADTTHRIVVGDVVGA